MSTIYKITISYPDGHIEELSEPASSLSEAKGIGIGYMAQIEGTEAYKGGKSSDDDFGFSKPKKPYFLIDEVVDGKAKAVYDSRRRK